MQATYSIARPCLECSFKEEPNYYDKWSMETTNNCGKGRKLKQDSGDCPSGVGDQEERQRTQTTKGFLSAIAI